MKKQPTFWTKKQNGHLLIGLNLEALSHFLPIEGIELPKLGKKIKKGEILCIIESSKSALELESPVTGKILKVHEEIKKNIPLHQNLEKQESWLCLVDPESQ